MHTPPGSGASKEDSSSGGDIALLNEVMIDSFDCGFTELPPQAFPY